MSKTRAPRKPGEYVQTVSGISAKILRATLQNGTIAYVLDIPKAAHEAVTYWHEKDFKK